MEGSHTIYGIAEERQGHNHAPAFRVDVGAFCFGVYEKRGAGESGEGVSVSSQSLQTVDSIMPRSPDFRRMVLIDHVRGNFSRPTVTVEIWH